MQKTRAEARRIVQLKLKLYQALYDCGPEVLTEVEHGIKACLEADADVLAAIERAKEAVRRRANA